MSTVTLPLLVQHPSPNHSTRGGAAVRYLVWHSTAGHYEPSWRWLCNPESQASAHLMLREDGGECSQLVRLAEKAWHAVALNGASVGVEHASVTAGFATHSQLERSARVFGWLCHHFNIPPVWGLHKPAGIVRHRDLGAMGGGHADGPDDHMWFSEYLPLVQWNVAAGGYRKEWAR